jgi:hypothetical protein
MHCPVDEHVRVQRFCPPGNIARHTSGDAHSPSVAHRSSSCFVPGPPVLLLELLELELLLLVLELLEVVCPPVPLLLVLLELLVPPPVPLLLVVGPPAGSHCALTLQM